MRVIEYDSIWAIGGDCLAQRVCADYAEEYIGNSPFTWTTVPYLKVAGDLLTTPELQTFSRDDVVPYNNKFRGTVDKRTGFWLSHHWTNVPDTEITEELIDKNWEQVTKKMARRYARILKQFKDPTAKPLLVWVGYGPFIEPQLSLWKKLSGCNVVGHWYDLEEAKEFLEKVRHAFPADVRMLYLCAPEDCPSWQVTYVDEHLVAGHVPFTYEERIGKEDYWGLEILEKSEALRHLVKAFNYETRLFAEWAESDYRSVYAEKPNGNSVYLTLNIKEKVGHRRREDDETFDILGYYDRAWFRIKWRDSGQEEFYTWSCKNHWKERKDVT